MSLALDIILVGATGRVGKEIENIIGQHPKHKIMKKVDSDGFDSEIKKMKPRKSAALVMIDFSSPGSAVEAAKWCADLRIPLVSGTTGLTESQFQALKIASKKTAVLWASNMSPGIQILNSIFAQYGAELKKYDLQMEEIHHNKKKDAPSGTAKTLQQTLEKSTKLKLPPVLSVRGGGVFGVHKLWAMSDEEVITFEHAAMSRAVFAKGAILCAEWIVNQKSGYYSMAEIFGGK